jgi:hypothetical protein
VKAVHCAACGWTGLDEEMEPKGSLARLHCPKCRVNSGFIIMYVTNAPATWDRAEIQRRLEGFFAPK